ncbi:hypothetical protein [Bizionia arctica]|uniref:Uncharacterized protein n=1 Tax=Bizionia arctica TaxID=1495645 RepID=A0A917GGU3_9FLAO|nr:hypothetical protein [Bizionia arctica]GGG44521.1 hypothetical protein GCM10010976_15160 [Bizionia arctica]
MKLSKNLFGALLLTCFLGFSQMTSAQIEEDNTVEKSETHNKVQEKSEVQNDSEMKKEQADVKAKKENKAREEKAIDPKATKKEKMDSDKE